MKSATPNLSVQPLDVLWHRFFGCPAPLFGEIDSDDAMEALYSGLTPEQAATLTFDRRVIESLPTGMHTWTGTIPSARDGDGRPVGKPATGEYLIPNPLSNSTIIALAQKPYEGQTLPRGIQGVVRTRAGLRGAVACLCVQMMEADEGTVEEQLENIFQLEDAAGFEFSVLALSGDAPGVRHRRGGRPRQRPRRQVRPHVRGHQHHRPGRLARDPEVAVRVAPG